MGFDPVVDVENARRDPELFFDNHRGRPLLLDEIQYAPEVVAALKRRIDRDPTPGNFLLTGSQQWEVMSSLAESLAGRVVFLDLEGFCLAEIAGHATANWLEEWLADPDAFAARPQRSLDPHQTLYEWLWRGALPDAAQLPLDTIPDFHSAYQRTYIERDVRLHADVADWQQFGRFVRLCSALTAQEINYSQLGRDIGLTPQSARRWLGRPGVREYRGCQGAFWERLRDTPSRAAPQRRPRGETRVTGGEMRVGDICILGREDGQAFSSAGGGLVRLAAGSFILFGAGGFFRG